MKTSLNKKRCLFCHEELETEDKYCPHCGRSVDGTVMQINQAVSNSQKVVKKSKIKPVQIILFIVVFIGILSATIAIGGRKTSNNYDSQNEKITSISNTKTEQRYFVSNENGGVNIREKPSNNAESLGKLAYGDDVIISNRNGSWGEITFKNQSAWIHLDYVQPYEENAVRYVVSENKYNGVVIHTKADFESESLIRIPEGTVLESSITKNGFLRVVYSGEDADTGNIYRNVEGYVALIWLKALE